MVFRHTYFKLLYTGCCGNKQRFLLSYGVLCLSSVPWCAAADLFEVWRNTIVQKSFHSSSNTDYIWDNMVVYNLTNIILKVANINRKSLERGVTLRGMASSV